jgi:hypothetical protein
VLRPEGLGEGGSGGGGVQQKRVETKGPAWPGHTRRHGSSVRCEDSETSEENTRKKKGGKGTPRERSGASVFMGCESLFWDKIG